MFREMAKSFGNCLMNNSVLEINHPNPSPEIATISFQDVFPQLNIDNG